MPKLYKNENINIKRNNKNICYIERKNINESVNINNIKKTINDIFNEIGQSYKIKVYIKTKDLSKETYLIAKNSEYIITIEKEIIPINNIIKIERLSKK